MATLTGCIDMPAHQMEGGSRVIKFHFLPGGGAVAGFTTLPQGTLMWIVLLMAGETVHGRALEQIISVTITAGYIDMPG